MTAGGKRPGAGRPLGTTKPSSKRRQINIRLTEEELAKAERIGRGNASAGLRAALGAVSDEPLIDTCF
jgi:hypothetical protein